MHHNISSIFYRLLDVWRSKTVIHHEKQIMFLSDFSHFLQIQNLYRRIGRSFQIKNLGLWANVFFYIFLMRFEISGIDIPLRKVFREKCMCRTKHRTTAEYVVARRKQRCQCAIYCRHSRSKSVARFSAFHFGDFIDKFCYIRVGKSTVKVLWFFLRETRSHILCIFKNKT